MDDAIAGYWNGQAPTFDEAADHGLRDAAVRDAWAARLGRWLPRAPGLVADLGCGTGSLAALAAGAGHRVVGVDVAPAMLRLARAKLGGATGAVGWVLGDAARPPLAPGCAGAVLARHVVWTLPDPGRALARWVELLRPGGTLILVEGRWGASGSGYVAGAETLPWAGGVGAAELAATVRPLVAGVEVEPLPDSALWGRPVDDERYAIIAVR